MSSAPRQRLASCSPYFSNHEMVSFDHLAPYLCASEMDTIPPSYFWQLRVQQRYGILCSYQWATNIGTPYCVEI